MMQKCMVRQDKKEQGQFFMKQVMEDTVLNTQYADSIELKQTINNKSNL